jgi:hypothetical protein
VLIMLVLIMLVLIIDQGAAAGLADQQHGAVQVCASIWRKMWKQQHCSSSGSNAHPWSSCSRQWRPSDISSTRCVASGIQSFSSSIHVAQ